MGRKCGSRHILNAVAKGMTTAPLKRKRNEKKMIPESEKIGNQMEEEQELEATCPSEKKSKPTKETLTVNCEENEYMTKYMAFFIRKADVSKLNKLKDQLKNEGLSGKQIKLKLRREERKLHLAMRKDIRSLYK